MRRVLIVSPHFPPVNAADHQRVRMSLPYLAEFGWSAVVLAVRPDAVEGAQLDEVLARTVPNGTQVVTTGAIPHRATRSIGLGNLALRAMPYLQHAGNRLLREREFDLIFFSTTQFPVLILGPGWKRKFSVPYIVDIQDPWVDDYYERTGTRPPGGKFRHVINRMLAKQLEPRVMRGVSHVISVSPAYVDMLRHRHPALRAEQFTVVPFGAAETDFALLDEVPVSQTVFDKKDGLLHLVYVGRAGDDMRLSLQLLFSALGATIRNQPDKWQNVRLHFVGTSYAPAGLGKKTVEPVAQEFGIAYMVDERPSRIGYFEALQALRDADALLIMGSDSAAYTPSKIYPYVLARRPIFALLNEASPAVSILRSCNAGAVVTFASETSDVAVEAAITALEETREAIDSGKAPDVDWQKFNQYSAREMTRTLCKVFDGAVSARLREALGN